MKERKNDAIFDKNVDKYNYTVFSACEIKNGGGTVCFVFPSGDVYDVTTRRLLTWFEAPHYTVCKDGSVREWRNGKIHKKVNAVAAMRIKFVLGGSAVRVYMSDNTAFVVAWDTVLMACEPRYEWYGGLPGSRMRRKGK